MDSDPIESNLPETLPSHRRTDESGAFTLPKKNRRATALRHGHADVIDALGSEALSWMSERGVFTRLTRAFAPAHRVRRGDAALYLWWALGSPSPRRMLMKSRIIDVADGEPYTEAVRWLVAHDELPPVRFQPDLRVTREDLALWMWKIAGRPCAGTNAPFDDVSEEARGAVSWLFEQSIAQGSEETHFNPQATLTKARMAEILCRFLASDALRAKADGH